MKSFNAVAQKYHILYIVASGGIPAPTTAANQPVYARLVGGRNA